MSDSRNNYVDIVEDLMRIHSVITHALEVMIEKSEAFLKKIPDRDALMGFTLFVDCFITFIGRKMINLKRIDSKQVHQYYEQFLRNKLELAFRVEAAGYPAAPPTDPYVKISLIRFLGSDLSETKHTRLRLAHNFSYP